MARAAGEHLSLYTYPWDIYDEGPAQAAARMKELGATTVHLAVTYHIGTYISPHNPVRPVWYGDHGAAYFPPDPSQYQEGGITPLPSMLLDEDPELMQKNIRALREAGMEVRAWALFGYNHALARAHPEAAKHDAFGQPYLAQLCVGHPRTRAYFKGLARDIMTHLDVDGLMAEQIAYMRWSYGFLNEKSAVGPSPRAKELLDLCFCDGCRQAGQDAGIDMERFQSQAADAIREDLNRQPLADPPAADDAWRQAAFDGALARVDQVRSQLASSMQHEVLDLCEGLAPDAVLEMANFGGILEKDRAAIYPRLGERRISVRPSTDVHRLRQRYDAVAAEYGEGTRRVAAMFAGVFKSAETVAKTVEMARSAGANGYRVYHYGLLSDRQLDWLGQIFGGAEG